MPIHVACPQCGTVLAVPEDAGGQVVSCPRCQGMMTLPQFPRSGDATKAGGIPGVWSDASGGEGGHRRPERQRSADEWGEAAGASRRIKTYPPVPASFVVGGISLVVNILMIFGIYSALAASALWSTKPRPAIRETVPPTASPAPGDSQPAPGKAGKSTRRS